MEDFENQEKSREMKPKSLRSAGNKHHNIMRKIVFSTGALSLSLFVLGWFFKILHTDYGGKIIGISMLLFALVFVPFAAWYIYKKKN